VIRTRLLRRAPRRADLFPRWWRRHPVYAVFVVAAVCLLAWGRLQTPLGTDHDRYHNRSFICVRVVDGDTFDIDIPDGKHQTTRIRLWGVDTPETSKSSRGAMYFGKEASAFTRSQIEGKRVHVVLDGEQTRGKYGRLLAYVYYDDGQRMLNEALIVQGYAYADRRFPHLWRARFVGLEKDARKGRAGLWGGVTREQMPGWRQRYEAWREGVSSRVSP